MRTLWPMLAAVVLSACDAVTTYGPVQSESPIPQQQLYIAAEKGAIVADVRGNPFPIPDARLAEFVRGHMRNALQGPYVRFVAAHGSETVEPYRVVVVFNAEPGAHFRNLCTDDAASPPKGATGTMTVFMGFCFGSDPISATWGSTYGISGPDDPKFRELVRRTALTLVPTYREDRRGGIRMWVPGWTVRGAAPGIAAGRAGAFERAGLASV